MFDDVCTYLKGKNFLGKLLSVLY